MKKILIIFLILLMLPGLVSCKKVGADSLYSEIAKNTLALEYIKFNLSVKSTVTSENSTLTIPTDSEIKIINQDGKITYLSTSALRFMIEDKMARVTLQHYYKDGILYQSAGDVKMKHELSAEKLWEGNNNAETLILKLPSELLTDVKVETKKKVSSFELTVSSKNITDDLKEQLDQIINLYSEVKYDGGNYTYGDLDVAVKSTNDGFISTCTALFTTTGTVSGVETTETISFAYEVVNPGNYFALDAPYSASEYEEGEFTVK
ncbi:MAG: hypothetical protein E7633_01955 [Ruminococcaceae bacterium]|nr:hypothetical protein [Oscillospiraceae bacterium]